MHSSQDFERAKLAIELGDLARLRELLRSGLNANATGDHGESLLMIAATREDSGITKELIDAGADLNAQDTFSYHNGGGATALHRAVEHKRKDQIKVLLAAGAKVDLKDKNGRTPLSNALTVRPPNSEDLQVAEMLLVAGASPHGKRASRETPLHDVAILGWVEAVRLLLKHGADPRKPNKVHVPILHKAIFAGSYETVRLLLDAGADIMAKDDQGRTALEDCTQGIENLKTVNHRLWPPKEAENLPARIANLEKIRDLLIAAQPAEHVHE